MAARSWDELDELLDRALDLDGEERRGFLDGLGLEAADRERLERLIASAEADDPALEPGGALGGRLGEEAARALDELSAPAADEIRGYGLVRPLGSGGMGEVWEAEQLEPVRRRVAVKILRPGMDTGRVVARFESERQTLARMSHPGIAQIFDAGLTASGRPFFSMELVDGAPLSEFCDRRGLHLRARLALFLEVCGAIEHAHQKGVVHRDLKPSNVLVASVSGRPSPKVIDFGIARLAEEPDAPATLLTEAGTVIGTPEYMSPEQAGAAPGDVDTRTDVYSLGVLLYELLTGALPFERRDSSPAALVDLFRDVRERELPRPSLRVQALGESALEMAEARGFDPPHLIRALRGDLDWITSRALEKERERRYPSVGELAADLERHLRDEPVAAGPPSAGYRLLKFARRNGGLLTASAAVLVALVAGLVGTATGLGRARDEARRARTQAAIARAVNAFLNEDLLAAVAPGAQGRDATLREVLDAAAAKLDGRFPEQPEVEAALRHTIGDTYLQLGRLEEASGHLERAVALREAALGDEDPDTLLSVHKLGELRFYEGRLEEAGALIRRAFAGRDRALGPQHRLTVAALSDLGAVAQAGGRIDEAERCYREAYERAREVLSDDPGTLSIQHNLGALLHERGRFDEAEEWLRRALEGSRHELGAEHPDTLVTLSLLGSVLREGGRLEEAIPIYVEAYEVRRRILGDEHPSTLMSANNLAMLHQDLDELAEAEALLRPVLEIQRRLLGPDHDATLLSLGNLGAVLTAAGKLDEAESLFREAVERCFRALGDEHPLCGETLRKQSDLLLASGRLEDAERVLRRAHGVLAGVYGDDHPEVVRVAERLAELYERRGRAAEAASWRARAETAPES